MFLKIKLILFKVQVSSKMVDNGRDEFKLKNMVFFEVWW
jgi:hypothetical protein